jgi:hypothetical protein
MKDMNGQWLPSILRLDASARNQVCYHAKLSAKEKADVSKEAKKFKRRATQAHWYNLQKQHRGAERVHVDNAGGGMGGAATVVLSSSLPPGGAAFDYPDQSQGPGAFERGPMSYVGRPLRDEAGEWMPWLLDTKVAIRRHLIAELPEAAKLDLASAVAKYKGRLRTQRLRDRKSAKKAEQGHTP